MRFRARICLLVGLAWSGAATLPASAQEPLRLLRPRDREDSGSRGRSFDNPVRRAALGATRVADRRGAEATEREGPTRVSGGSGVLPQKHGQVWREYAIRPYTARVEGVAEPQKAVIDWILRETGTDAWHGEVFAALTADRDTLRVYHTPKMQEVVRRIVDRFLASRPEAEALGMRLVTLQSPNWRIRALPLMEPVEVQSPGVEGWLLSKENAVLLYNSLKKRTDFYQHSAGDIGIHNGQSFSIKQRRPRRYVKTVRMSRNPFPTFHPVMGTLNEGYSLQISALFDTENQTLDAVIKAEVDQIEQLVPVTVDLPGFSNQRQRLELQVPQVVSWRLHERFVWPRDKVLLLSCGVVASPTPERRGLLGLNLPFTGGSGGGRADALLFVENNGAASQALVRSGARTARTAPNYHGRY